jgi:hypothetical protein
MTHDFDDAKAYWNDFVIPTVRNASVEIKNFVSSMTRDGNYICFKLAGEVSPTEMMKIIGSNLHIAAGELTDFDAISLRFVEAMSLVSDNANDRYFGGKNIESLALMWLKDVMAVMYDLAHKYYNAVPHTTRFFKECEGCSVDIKKCFPLIIGWEMVMHGQTGTIDMSKNASTISNIVSSVTYPPPAFLSDDSSRDGSREAVGPAVSGKRPHSEEVVDRDVCPGVPRKKKVRQAT